jgi:hypothetical protein
MMNKFLPAVCFALAFASATASAGIALNESVQIAAGAIDTDNGETSIWYYW